MHNKVKFFLAVICFAMAGTMSIAQPSSINTYSPYSFYGLGDLSNLGSSVSKSMGGIGIATRDPLNINYQNPASLNSVLPNCMLLNLCLEGQNYYNKTKFSSTSYNSMNFSDLGLGFAIKDGIGMALSISPFSSIGYENTILEKNPDILQNTGSMLYKYVGEGNISQANLGIGFRVTKKLSFGLNYTYYFGEINRYMNTEMLSLDPNQLYRNTFVSKSSYISKSVFSAGAQYSTSVGTNKRLTLGATYQPKFTANFRHTDYAVVTGVTKDTLFYNTDPSDLKLPGKLAVGVFYQQPRFGIGLDYQTQNWNGSFENDAINRVSFGRTQTFKLGGQYNPDKESGNNMFRKWTYRWGARYGNSYIRKNGRDINEVALSFGVGIPLKSYNPSTINVGVEVGQRGTTNYNLVKERFIKVYIGLNLFGDDQWFSKIRYF